MNTGENRNQPARWLRWLARALCSLVAGFWLTIAAISGVYGSDPWTWESTIMAGLIVASVLGVLAAWWREAIGGTILVIVAIAHSTFAFFAAGHSRGFAMLISGGPFLLLGALFLLSWRSTKRIHEDADGL